MFLPLFIASSLGPRQRRCTDFTLRLQRVSTKNFAKLRTLQRANAMREAAFMGLGLFANCSGTNIFSFGSHKNGDFCKNLWQYVPAVFIRLHIEDWIQLWLKANPLANWLSLLQVKLWPNFPLSIHSLPWRTNGHLTKTVSQSRAEWSGVQSWEEILRILPGYSRNLGPKLCTSSVIFWLLRWQCTFPPTFVRSFWCAEIRHCLQVCEVSQLDFTTKCFTTSPLKSLLSTF